VNYVRKPLSQRAEREVRSVKLTRLEKERSIQEGEDIIRVQSPMCFRTNTKPIEIDAEIFEKTVKPSKFGDWDVGDVGVTT